MGTLVPNTIYDIVVCDYTQVSLSPITRDVLPYLTCIQGKAPIIGVEVRRYKYISAQGTAKDPRSIPRKVFWTFGLLGFRLIQLWKRDR